MDPSRFSRNCDESRETLANFSASIDRVCEKRRTKPDRWERTWPRVIALRDCSQGGGGWRGGKAKQRVSAQGAGRCLSETGASC